MDTLNPTPTPPLQPRGDATKEALVRAATHIFARFGFHAASTRAIAQAAQANQALIGYHFNGKEGLYLAVFDDIVDQLQAKTAPMVVTIQTLLAQSDASLNPAERRARYLPPLLAVTEGMLELMLGQETENWSQLIMREQQQPTAAFERLYEKFMGRMLAVLSKLVQRLRNDAAEKDAKEIVVGILGQVLVWRIARAGIMLHLNWTTLGEAEMEQARKTLRHNIVALVFSSRNSDEA